MKRLCAGRRPSLAAVLSRPVQEGVQGGPEVLADPLLQIKSCCRGEAATRRQTKAPLQPSGSPALNITSEVAKDATGPTPAFQNTFMKKVRLRRGLGSDFNPSKHGQRTPLLTAHLRPAGPSRPDGSFQNTHSCSLPEKSIRFIHEEQEAGGGKDGREVVRAAQRSTLQPNSVSGTRRACDLGSGWGPRARQGHAQRQCCREATGLCQTP